MSSLIYSNRTIYHLVMRLLYGRYFSAHYESIASLIPNGASVIDVCAGDGYLYLQYLRQKIINYIALDVSPHMVNWMQRHGIKAQQFDMWQDAMPIGDIVVMQASLYQFLPNAELITEKMLAAARQRLIIAEPIRNLTSSNNQLLAVLGRWLTVPERGGESYTGSRFNRESLTEFFNRFAEFEGSNLLPGEREMLGIFRGRCCVSIANEA